MTPSRPAYLRKQWQPTDLPVGSVREHQGFQYRVLGNSPDTVRKIVGTLEAGGDTRDPIRVARVGKALYVVDGFHRLEAYRQARRETVPSLVAKLSLEEAKEAARAYNAMNGRPFSRADKEAVWADYIRRGRHLEPSGDPKKARAISVELGGTWSHETVRKRLRALGLLDEDAEFDGAYKPFGENGWDTEDDLVADVAQEASDGLRAFGERVGTLHDFQRDRLLRTARSIIEAVEQGEEPDLSQLPRGGLDI